MALLLIGMAVFLGIHLLPSLPRKRHKLMKLFGETTYKAAYGIIALSGLVLIVWGYARTYNDPIVLFDMPLALRHVTMLLVFVSFIMFVSARLKGYIRYWVRHPLLLAVKLWAFGHLLVKGGDVAGLVLFGGFLAWAVFLRISAKKREQVGLIKTRNFEPNWLNDLIALVVGTLIYLAFAFYLHKWLIGVPLIH